MPAKYHRIETDSERRLKAVPCYCQQVELPLEQPYRVTSMIRSHERKTDELVPAPTKVDLSERQIRSPYPAEHKWSSHIPRLSLFPAFDTNQSDLRYAVEQWHYPKSPSLPNKRDDYYVLEKQRCDNRRHELVRLPQGTAQRQHTEWPSDLQWQVYPRNMNPQTYPIPPKLVLPNMPVPVEREQQLGLAVSARAANAARNYQKDLWQSTTHRHYSGLGEQHPNALDDFDVKALRFPVTEQQLEPRSVDTMVPSTSFGGRASPAYKQLSMNQKLYRESTFVPDMPSMLQRARTDLHRSPRSSPQPQSEDDQDAQDTTAESEQDGDVALSPHEQSADRGVPMGSLLGNDVLLLRRKQALLNPPANTSSSMTQLLYNQEKQLTTDQADRGRPLIPFTYTGMPTTRFSTDSFSRLQSSYPRSMTGHVMLDVYRHQKREADNNYLARGYSTARESSTCSEQQTTQNWKQYLRDAALHRRSDTDTHKQLTGVSLPSSRTDDASPVDSDLMRAMLTERRTTADQRRMDATGDRLDQLKAGYVKTQMHTMFNDKFPEKTPNVYDNNTKGKRHVILVN